MVKSGSESFEEEEETDWVHSREILRDKLTSGTFLLEKTPLIIISNQIILDKWKVKASFLRLF